MFEDDEFQMIFYMVPPVPTEMCKQFGLRLCILAALRLRSGLGKSERF